MSNYKRLNVLLVILLIVSGLAWYLESQDNSVRFWPSELVKKRQAIAQTRSVKPLRSFTPPPSALALSSPSPTFVPAQTPTPDEDLTSVDTSQLASQLSARFGNINRASETDIEQNIRLANELISRDPEYYPAYKAKLVNLLVQEIRFGKEQELATYDELYDELLAFSGVSEEDLVIAQAQLQRGQQVNAAELSGIDRDLIHIPFLRLAALKENEALAEMSEEYIAAYPDSYIGYLYMARATWNEGDQASAVNIFKTVMGEQASDAAIVDTLSRLEAESPIDQIMRMKLDY